MRLIIPILALSLVAATADAVASDQPDFNRASIIEVMKSARHISTPEGIESLEQVAVDGDKQWISIRGRNRANPVLLFIHGGPGFPMMPLNWAYQGAWEDYFTVVNWDQRGVGKNAISADRKKLLPSISLDQIVQDGAAVIDYLRARLGKEKVVVLGHSWGSRVGAHLAHRFPDKVSVYVGVGQSVSPSDEGVRYRETIAAAERAGDVGAVAELKALGPYPRPNGDFPADVGATIRHHARRLDGMWYGHEDLKPMQDMSLLAPEYSDADVEAFRQGSSWLEQSQVRRDMRTDDLRRLHGFKAPIVLLLGRYDLTTPYAAGRAWFNELDAPKKALVTFERSSHFAMIEEPGRFLSALISEVLPLTEGNPAYPVLPHTGEKQP